MWRYFIAIIIWIVANHYVLMVPEGARDAASLQLMTSYYPYYLLGNVVKRYKLHDLAFSNGCVFFCLHLYGRVLHSFHSDIAIML